MSELGARLQRSGAGLPPPGGDPLERLVRRRDGKRRNERLMAGVVSLALVGGVLGGSLVVLQHMSRAPGHVAIGPMGARTGTAPALPDGSYVYRTATLTSQGYFTVGSNQLDHLAFTMTTWWANDGSGRVEHGCITSGCETSYGFGPSGVFDAGAFPTDDDVTGLSSDPQTLLTQLEARSGAGGNSPEPAFSPGPELADGVTVGAVLDAAVNILEDPNGSPELKAACYDVIRGMPTVEETDGVTDPAGRPAVQLRFEMDTWGPVDYFFDPTTHLLMAEDSGGVGSADHHRATIYHVAIVGSTDATPAADQSLFPEAPQPSPSP